MNNADETWDIVVGVVVLMQVQRGIRPGLFVVVLLLMVLQKDPLAPEWLWKWSAVAMIGTCVLAKILALMIANEGMDEQPN